MLIPKDKKITYEVSILPSKQPFSCFPWLTSYDLQNHLKNFLNLNKAQGGKVYRVLSNIAGDGTFVQTLINKEPIK